MVDVVKRQSLTYNGVATGNAACSDKIRHIWLRDWNAGESNWHIQDYDTFLDTLTWTSNNASFTAFTNFSNLGTLQEAAGPVFFKDDVYVLIANEPSFINRIGVARYTGTGTTWELVYEVATLNTSDSAVVGLFSDGTRLMACYADGDTTNPAGGWRVAHSTTGNSGTWTDIAFAETTDVPTYFGSYNQPPVLVNSFNNSFDLSPQIMIQNWQNFPSPTLRSIRLFQWNGTTFAEAKEAHASSAGSPPVIDTGDTWLKDVDWIATSYLWGNTAASVYQYMTGLDGG